MSETYTSVDIAVLLNVPLCKVRQVSRELKLKINDERIGYKHVITYNQDQFELIKNALGKNKGEVLTLEQLRELHPLVKDDRFFKTTFFPDVKIDEEL